MTDASTLHHAPKKSKKHKKMKKNAVSSEEIASFKSREPDNEDLAESVDSGCIPDSSSDIMVEVFDTAQIKAAVLAENKFISNFLQWLPAPVQSIEPEVEVKKGRKRKREELKKEEELLNKKVKVALEATGDLDELQGKYRSMLEKLRKTRNKKWDPSKKKKETRIARKLKSLERRKVKTKKNKKQTEEPLISTYRKGKNKNDNSQDLNQQKPQKSQKPIYNKKGKLVFSKFDFSNNSLSEDTDNNKSKDLKQMLSQALKEKEKMKHLEKKGDKEAAIDIAENKAWSNALEKAEGKKVKNDVELLKKSIRKKESRKKTSQKKWQQRLDTQEKNKMDKESQRKKNLSARKESKIEKKMKKLKRKGHIVPGF